MSNIYFVVLIVPNSELNNCQDIVLILWCWYSAFGFGVLIKLRNRYPISDTVILILRRYVLLLYFSVLCILYY